MRNIGYDFTRHAYCQNDNTRHDFSNSQPRDTIMKIIKQLALTLILAVASLDAAQAVAPEGKQVTAAIELQGGSSSIVRWPAPATGPYKVHVLVPATGTVSNALYRVYPNGKKADSLICESIDALNPCFEVSVDQTQHQNMWVQLTLNDDAATQWNFNKNKKGYVAAIASNLNAEEVLNLSPSVRFEDVKIRAIGSKHQGGIIFYLDGTGKHGLIAAPKDQNNTGLQWFNDSFVITDALGTDVGTGLANTNMITQIQGEGNYAASLAANLVIGAYSDWYLPSKDELNLMYNNIGPGAPAPFTNIGGFIGYDYWSSSEASTNNAAGQNFATGVQSFYGKSGLLYVRAIRAF